MFSAFISKWHFRHSSLIALSLNLLTTFRFLPPSPLNCRRCHQTLFFIFCLMISLVSTFIFFCSYLCSVSSCLNFLILLFSFSFFVSFFPYFHCYFLFPLLISLCPFFFLSILSFVSFLLFSLFCYVFLVPSFFLRLLLFIPFKFCFGKSLQQEQNKHLTNEQFVNFFLLSRMTSLVSFYSMRSNKDASDRCWEDYRLKLCNFIEKMVELKNREKGWMRKMFPFPLSFLISLYLPIEPSPDVAVTQDFFKF